MTAVSPFRTVMQGAALAMLRLRNEWRCDRQLQTKLPVTANARSVLRPLQDRDYSSKAKRRFRSQLAADRLQKKNMTSRWYRKRLLSHGLK